MTVIIIIIIIIIGKGKDHPAQAEVAQGVPGRLRSRIFLTFGTTRVVGRQPYAPAAFIPGEIPGNHFQRLSRPQGTWFRREPRKKCLVTPPGIDPETCRSALTTTLPQAPIIIIIIIIVVIVIVVIIIIIQIYTVPKERKNCFCSKFKLFLVVCQTPKTKRIMTAGVQYVLLLTDQHWDYRYRV